MMQMVETHVSAQLQAVPRERHVVLLVSQASSLSSMQQHQKTKPRVCRQEAVGVRVGLHIVVMVLNLTIQLNVMKVQVMVQMLLAMSASMQMMDLAQISRVQTRQCFAAMILAVV
jgi:hypothetical protein